MARQVATHLIFDGVAVEVMHFYVALFPGSQILAIARYGPGEQGVEGTIKRAAFTLSGQYFICIDSSVKHDFTFTPAMSIYVDCDSYAGNGASRSRIIILQGTPSTYRSSRSRSS